MQNRASANPELVTFFNQQSSGWFATYGISYIAIPAVAMTLASSLAANHPILSKAALLLSILDIAEPFYANYYEKPGPFMLATSAMHRAGSSMYQSFFGPKPAATVKPEAVTNQPFSKNKI